MLMCGSRRTFELAPGRLQKARTPAQKIPAFPGDVSGSLAALSDLFPLQWSTPHGTGLPISQVRSPLQRQLTSASLYAKGPPKLPGSFGRNFDTRIT
jgi:hypothetical protein